MRAEEDHNPPASFFSGRAARRPAKGMYVWMDGSLFQERVHLRRRVTANFAVFAARSRVVGNLTIGPMICALAVASLGLLIPTTPTLPTTNVLAVGVIQNTNIIKGDLYKGGTDTLDLSSMLDNVPDDLKGAEGAAADAAGKARMAERGSLEAVKKMTPAEAQAAKKAEFAAKQAAQAGKSLFPEVALPSF